MDETYLNGLMTEFGAIADQLKKLESRKKEIRNIVADHMHKIKQNEIIVEDSTGKTWACAYQSSARKSVNYEKLYEVVGPEKYDQVVSNNKSTALYIRKAPKPKADTKVNNAPNEQNTNSNMEAPIGVLS